MKVLFLDGDNLGRSVFAESLYNSITLSEDACSAGIQVADPEETLGKHKPAKFILEVLEEEGIDVSKHTKQTVTEDMATGAEVLVDLSGTKATPAFVKKHPKRIVWKIDDPKGQSLEEHFRIKNEMKDKVRKLLNP